jgi:hypothetical protein
MSRRPMHVTIVAEEDASKPDRIAFHMEDSKGCKLPDDIPLTFSKKGHSPPMYKTDEHEIHFKLKQDPGMTLEFAHSKQDVLWVEMGDEDNMPDCPKEEPDQPCAIFYAEKSTPNTLIVVNTNPCKQHFSYTINFVDRTNPGPKKLIPYDPGGTNSNEGEDRIVEAGGVVVGAIAAMALFAVAFVFLR